MLIHPVREKTLKLQFCLPSSFIQNYPHYYWILSITFTWRCVILVYYAMMKFLQKTFCLQKFYNCLEHKLRRDIWMAKNLLRVISYYVKKLKDYRTPSKCKTILSTKANTVMVRTQQTTKPQTNNCSQHKSTFLKC